MTPLCVQMKHEINDFVVEANYVTAGCVGTGMPGTPESRPSHAQNNLLEMGERVDHVPEQVTPTQAAELKIAHRLMKAMMEQQLKMRAQKLVTGAEMDNGNGFSTKSRVCAL